MADARALLKLKRQEARISHPFANYNASGQLRCSVCGTVVKHASAWEGHLGSKLHRTNVARLKGEKQREELERQQEAKGKRKAESEEPMPVEKKRRVEGGFPDDFFSDPSRNLEVSTGDSDEEGEENTVAASSLPAVPEVDMEYERFQRELLTSQAPPTEVYESATVMAEPVLATVNMEGIPTEGEKADEPVVLSENELRAKKAEEERELIMDRLLEEERAQEDADSRVNLMKARVEMLKKKREQRLASRR